MRQALQHIKVVPGFGCSRGCFYCYNTLLGQQSPSEDSSELLAALDGLLDDAAPGTEVEVIGGEPLEKRYVQSSIAVMRAARSHPHCSTVSLSTAMVSATALQPAVALVDKVYLSLDVSSSRRNRKRLQADRLQGALRTLAASSVDVLISTVIHGDETDEEISDFLDNLLAAGATSVGFTHRTATRLDVQEIASTARIFRTLFRERLRRREGLDIGGALLHAVDCWVRGVRIPSECDCGDASLVIEADGHVVDGVCVDHAQPLVDIDDSRPLRRQLLRAGECNGCDLWSVCGGGCSNEALQLDGNQFARAGTYCAVLSTLTVLVAQDLPPAVECAVRAPYAQVGI